MKICHMTDAHNRYDIRIFEKECKSLANEYETYLVVTDNKPDEEICGVRIRSTGFTPSSRKERFLIASRKVYKLAKSLECDVYHFHDPTLLPYGLLLSLKGKKVIFDSHEDVSGQIEDKEWIPKWVRVFVSKTYFIIESLIVKHLTAVVAATPHIATTFEGRAKRVVVVNNYPKLDDIEYHNTSFAERDSIICYAGGINELRGEKVMIEAMKNVDATLILAGPHSGTFDGSVNVSGGGKLGNVVYCGWLDRNGINELYAKSQIGLVVLMPITNYLKSQPIKMFEYMASGLPFICSDFPLWKEITETYNCGICVNPSNVSELHDAINYLLNNLSIAEQMGKNGREAVCKHFSWNNEKRLLFGLYEEIKG